MLDHPDGALVVAGNRPTADLLPDIERQLSVLVAVGFPPGEALRALWAIGAYVGGDAIETQAEAARPAGIQVVEEAALADVRSGRYPLVLAAVQEAGTSAQDRFEEGLDLLIDGLRARLARRGDAHYA
jgi:TetR/AcrR family tetracycline transcriptional repressor